MRVQHSFRRERFVTARAGIGSITRMTPQVYYQRSPLCEPFVAVWTMMRFLASVRTTMHAQIVLRNEALAADIANVWLLASVLAQMHRQVSLAGHRLVTYRACVFALWTDVAVRFHMHQ